MDSRVTRWFRPASICIVAAVLVTGAMATEVAEACSDGRSSVSAAPKDRCGQVQNNGLEKAPLVKGTGDDVFGAEILAVDSMISSSLATPGVATPLSAIPSGIGPGGSLVQGCDFDAFADFSTIYCIEGNGGFFTVDTTSGMQSLIGFASVSGPDGVFTGLASDPTSGTMYAVATSESSPGTGDCATDSGLYTVDLATATAVRIGSIPDLSCVIAAAFDNSGQLYAYGVVSNMLVAIDKTSGDSTAIGDIGFNANFAQGMDFDASTNTCYLFAFNDDNASGSEGELRTCDTQTGATSLVGPLGTGSSEISGAGIVGEAFIFKDGFEGGDTTLWSSTTP